MPATMAAATTLGALPTLATAAFGAGGDLRTTAGAGGLGDLPPGAALAVTALGAGGVFLACGGWLPTTGVVGFLPWAAAAVAPLGGGEAAFAAWGDVPAWMAAVGGRGWGPAPPAGACLGDGGAASCLGRVPAGCSFEASEAVVAVWGGGGLLLPATACRKVGLGREVRTAPPPAAPVKATVTSGASTAAAGPAAALGEGASAPLLSPVVESKLLLPLLSALLLLSPVVESKLLLPLLSALLLLLSALLSSSESPSSRMLVGMWLCHHEIHGLRKPPTAMPPPPPPS